jgi:hypothetical protein
MSDRFRFGIDLQTGEPYLDSLRRRLADAAQNALSDVRAGRFAAAEAQVLAVDREIQSAVMLGAMYTRTTTQPAATRTAPCSMRCSRRPLPDTRYAGARSRGAFRVCFQLVRGECRC